MTTLGYYPGCSSRGTSVEFDLSTREVFKALGIVLTDIPDWNCCGASPGHSIKEEIGLALSYLNLVKAQRAGLKEILVTCPSCYSNLLKARDVYMESPEERKRLSKLYGEIDPYEIKIYHLLDYVHDGIGEERIKDMVKKPPEGFRIASYYGCLPRLPHVSIDSKENPTLMDTIVSWIGADVVDWPFKVYCCGAGLSVPRPDITKDLAGKILDMAVQFKADAIAVVCPLCQFNLDSKEKALGFCLPVPYLTQIMGLSFGLPPHKLGIDKALTSTARLRGLYA